jgi:hypothetical protein
MNLQGGKMAKKAPHWSNILDENRDEDLDRDLWDLFIDEGLCWDCEYPDEDEFYEDDDEDFRDGE